LLIALRVLALVAIATSAALFIDYVSYSPAFCSAGSGCSAVRASGFGYVAGIPVPAFGVAAYGFLLIASLIRRPTWRSIFYRLSMLGGVIAVALIAVQAFSIRQYCALCLVVDVSAIVMGIGAFLLSRQAPSDDVEANEPEPIQSWAWIGLVALATAAPLVWPTFRPQPPVPQSIQQFYQSGKINVVEFADFECPFCRMLHPMLKKLVKEHEGKVNFVRLNMPLQRHEHAMDAAKGAVCAATQNKKEEMADALFESEDLSPTAIRRMAVALGVEPNAFDRCVSDPKTEAQIQQESKILKDAGFQGLPTTYVGAKGMVGALSEETFREAFAAAERGEGAEGIPAPAFIAVSLLAAGAIVYFGRARSEPEKPKQKAPADKKRKRSPKRQRAREAESE